jgi:pyruvate dehydrogenase E1 component alpha subunit
MDREQRLDLYRWMRLTRTFDDVMVAMWKQGRGVGGTFSQRGHEAISVGVAAALGPDDVVAPMHRDLGTYLYRGMSPERIFGNLLGRVTGPSGGRDANLHGLGDLTLGIIGFISHIPQALPTTLGAAMAFRYRDEPRVAVTFVGDGSTTSGGFHETMNMAALYNAPFVLIAENNQYAYSTPLEQSMKVTAIVEKAAGYGMEGVRIDGNDVELVLETAREAIEKARGGGGPTLIETVTMRMLGHAIHDGAEYVPREQLAEWEAKDPVVRYRRRLLEEQAASEAELDHLDEVAKQLIAQAVAAAQAAPLPDPDTLEDGVYA